MRDTSVHNTLRVYTNRAQSSTIFSGCFWLNISVASFLKINLCDSSAVSQVWSDSSSMTTFELQATKFSFKYQWYCSGIPMIFFNRWYLCNLFAHLFHLKDSDMLCFFKINICIFVHCSNLQNYNNSTEVLPIEWKQQVFFTFAYVYRNRRPFMLDYYTQKKVIKMKFNVVTYE